MRQDNSDQQQGYSLNDLDFVDLICPVDKVQYTFMQSNLIYARKAEYNFLPIMFSGVSRQGSLNSAKKKKKIYL